MATAYLVYVTFQTDIKKGEGRIMLPDVCFKETIYQEFVAISENGVFGIAEILRKRFVGKDTTEIRNDIVPQRTIVGFEIEGIDRINGTVLLESGSA